MTASLQEDAWFLIKGAGVQVGERVAASQVMQDMAIRALDEEGFLDKAALQGGSAIAGCYGGGRLSLDLDFAAPEGIASEEDEGVKDALTTAFQGRYGEGAHVSSQKKDFENAAMARWRINVPLVPDRPDIPGVRLKVEAARVPAREVEARPFSLPGIPSKTVVLVESRDELMADKLVSFAASGHERWRDVWDIMHLSDFGTPVDKESLRQLVEYKIQDYGQASGQFLDRLHERMDLLDQAGSLEKFAKSLDGMMIDGKRIGRRQAIGALTHMHEELGLVDAVVEKMLQKAKGHADRGEN